MSTLHATRSQLPPELPTIKEEYRPYVFTHRSYHFHKNATINPDDRLLDYDRLEFLGEGILQGALSLYLYDTYQWHRSGHLKTVKSQLSTRDKLAGFSDAYGLVEQIRVDPGSERNIRNSQDVRAHVFKAYIGAVQLTHNFEYVVGWVVKLMQWSSSSSSSANATPAAPSPASLPNPLSPYTSSSPFAAPGGPTLGGMSDRRAPPGLGSGPSSPTNHSFRSSHRPSSSISSSTRGTNPPSTLFSNVSLGSTLPTPAQYGYSSLRSEEDSYAREHVGSILRGVWDEFDEPVERTRPSYRPRHNDLEQLWPNMENMTIRTNSPPRSRATAFGTPSPLSRYGIPSVHGSSVAPSVTSAAPTPAAPPVGLSQQSEELEDVTNFGTVEKFNERCHQRFIKPEWAFNNVGDSLFNKWQAIVKVKGEEKGRGVGRSKQIAKELAARKAMKEMRW